MNVQCPTCAMTARRSDHRLLRPVVSEIVEADAPLDLRQCRNCGGIVAIRELADA